MSKICRLGIVLQARRDQRGLDLIEYGLIAAFLVLTCAVLLTNFPRNISMVISKIWSALAVHS